MILRLLDELGGHHTAEELNTMLATAGTPLTRGTVYNVLDDLVGAGLAMRADRGPGTAIYELTDSWHHHFVCRQCSIVVDVPCVVDQKACLHADLPGAVLEEAQIIFRGLCPDCAAQR
jgi:Fur family ferric uptake transcriptional regulator